MGTHTIIPGTPHRPPHNTMAKSTQKLESPVRSPRIFGPITFPSSCCNASTKTMNHRPFTGFSIIIRKVEGTAPMMGPKKGITLVTPTKVETSRALGNRKMLHPI